MRVTLGGVTRSQLGQPTEGERPVQLDGHEGRGQRGAQVAGRLAAQPASQPVEHEAQARGELGVAQSGVAGSADRGGSKIDSVRHHR